MVAALLAPAPSAGDRCGVEQHAEHVEDQRPGEPADVTRRDAAGEPAAYLEVGVRGAAGSRLPEVGTLERLPRQPSVVPRYPQGGFGD